MATIRLVPSVTAVNNASYASIADASNMYTNTDSTTHGTFTHNRATTNNTYYGYIRGFNFDDVPDDAIVTGWTVKIKASATGHTTSTSSSYYMSLINNTTQIGSTSASGRLSTTVTTFTFAEGSLTWDTIVGYGSNFGIRIPMRRASSNTADVVSVYGAEIEVTYTIPVYHDITVTNNTSATVSPTGTTNLLEGEDFVVSTSTLSGLRITDNGADVTSQFTPATGSTVSETPNSTFTTGFSSSSGHFYQSSSTTSTSWLEYAIGHTAESPYSTSNTNNTYVKPEGSTGWINYHFDFSHIPTSATINSVSVKVYGGREDSTVDSTHVARFQCYSGSTAKGTIQNFTSTSNGLVTVSDVGTWTATELHDAQLRFELGYYGGRMLGITWTVMYTMSGYVYTITNVVADHTIVFNYSGEQQPELYVKVNGTWKQVQTAYKKINGTWQSVDISTVFNSSDKYVKGDI